MRFAEQPQGEGQAVPPHVRGVPFPRQKDRRRLPQEDAPVCVFMLFGLIYFFNVLFVYSRYGFHFWVCQSFSFNSSLLVCFFNDFFLQQFQFPIFGSRLFFVSVLFHDTYQVYVRFCVFLCRSFKQKGQVHGRAVEVIVVRARSDQHNIRQRTKV